MFMSPPGLVIRYRTVERNYYGRSAEIRGEGMFPLQGESSRCSAGARLESAVCDAPDGFAVRRVRRTRTPRFHDGRRSVDYASGAER
jgi:hypothetical protein